MRQAIAYTRVSTKGQGDNGIGLDLQETQIRAYAKASRIQLLDVLREVETGTGETGINDRPVLQEAISTARRLGIPIIVSNLDRLTRNTDALLAFLADEGVKLIALNVGRSKKELMIVDAARAQREVELISELTKVALKKKKADGYKLGNHTNLDEARERSGVVRSQDADERARQLAPVIAELKEAGIKSLRKMAAALNERGIKPAQGGTWSFGSVKNVISRLEAMQSGDVSESTMPEKQADTATDQKPCAVWGSW
ncbi:recombinase family protein [Paramagnetospirillum magnetotacticum]|uniref:recombinase family protein n=1 Tax=Paramagnetospirillum magnetotacticum TaxID=188 RepID=UPI00069613BC|nr:recombinase family protein [Paramagnetospirillum magnetotacticum]